MRTEISTGMAKKEGRLDEISAQVCSLHEALADIAGRLDKKLDDLFGGEPTKHGPLGEVPTMPGVTGRIIGQVELSHSVAKRIDEMLCRLETL